MSSIPVLVITFNRPEHTRRTLEALRVQRPGLVYVFQDGARNGNADDVEKCSAVRSVIERSIDWPCELHTYYSDCNRGCRDAVIFAVSSVLKEHESVIVLEDDIVTSPAFLSYMQKALDYYKDRKSVFSISGHSHCTEHFVKPADYPYDVYASPRLFNWGWGTWRDRWEKADWSFSYYEDLMKHPWEMEGFLRGGDDLGPMLQDEHDGRSSAWDIQFAFTHFREHAVSIVPCVSYTHNIGQDGSGTHCSDCAKGDIDYSELNQNENPLFLENLYFDSRILNAQCSYFSNKKRPLWQKGCNFIARKLGLKPPFVLKKRIYAE